MQIAPTYIILSGRDEGCLITRDRINRIRPLNLKDRNTIVQTNIDHWSNDPRENIENSIKRRDFAYEWMNDNDIDEDYLWDLMNTSPVLANNTLYTTGMCVAHNYYESRLI